MSERITGKYEDKAQRPGETHGLRPKPPATPPPARPAPPQGSGGGSRPASESK